MQRRREAKRKQQDESFNQVHLRHKVLGGLYEVQSNLRKDCIAIITLRTCHVVEGAVNDRIDRTSGLWKVLDLKVSSCSELLLMEKI